MREVHVMRRRYFDHLTTPRGMMVSSPCCEHCDGVDSTLVREDDLRGWVCPVCDSALDEMFSEGAYRRHRRAS